VERIERDGQNRQRRAFFDERRRQELVAALSRRRDPQGIERGAFFTASEASLVNPTRLDQRARFHGFEHARAAIFRALPTDPRLLQIAALAALLGGGAWWRDFAIRPEQSALAFAAAFATQRLGERWRGARPAGIRSAAITALSLSLLLRADNAWAHPLAACVAIGAKFLLRIRNKHVFNPGNLGVVFALAALPGTWVSPGQWGDDVALAGWFVALGGLVVQRARRADVTAAFLFFHLGALALRVAWLGQRGAVWFHQLQSGALLLFAFFMISDPMTIPDDRRGRTAHAALVASLAYLWQFALYRPNALLWALFVAAPAVPLWDALWPAARYEWKTQGGSHVESQGHAVLHGRPRRFDLARGAA
jgi:enediyne biosynthesis protein E5